MVCTEEPAGVWARMTGRNSLMRDRSTGEQVDLKSRKASVKLDIGHAGITCLPEVTPHRFVTK